MKESHITEVAREVDGQPVIFTPPRERILGRRVVRWSNSCGTYEGGGPGFFGLCLAANEVYPEEWLILRLWGAADWLSVNGRWLSAAPGQYKESNPPLYSQFYKAGWDMFAPLVEGKLVSKFNILERTCDIEIGDAKISLNEDPTSRPIFAGSRELRALLPGDDLRNAWIIASKPWVRI